MTGWTCTQLSFGSAEGRYHAHSYYDIPVVDAAGRRILAHRTGFAERPVAPEDGIEIGLLDAEAPGTWTPLGRSRAWSWQQGPLAQWVAGGPVCVWNDREGDRFVARRLDTRDGTLTTLPRPVYAVDPQGRFALGLNMARLDTLRPGYGYAGGSGDRLDDRCPEDCGVWRMALEGGAAPELLLSLGAARSFLMRLLPLRDRLRHGLARYHYWFNHAKIAPGGARFTVKLRWRRRGGPWNEGMGVSLTCDTATGTDLRLLADATSHVIWQTDSRAYFWRKGEVSLFEDTAPRGTYLSAIGAGTIDANVHIRHLPPGPDPDPPAYVLDTPYRETIDLGLYDPRTKAFERIARFDGHRPARGPYRCDLHPCPSGDGRRIVVTSTQDGGRQVYVLTRRDA